MTCKGCLGEVVSSTEEVEKLVSEQLQLETNLVNDELYVKRLEACKSCSSLSHDTTCNHCGCYVQFRAKLTYKSCPHPGGSKW